jgi:hypothetical protein
LRARTAFRVGLVLVVFAVVFGAPVLAVPAVLFAAPVAGVFAFALFALAFDGADVLGVPLPCARRRSGRVSPRGGASAVSLPADLSVARVAPRAGTSGGFVPVYIGCDVRAGDTALCFRRSRAASSGVRRPACV